MIHFKTISRGRSWLVFNSINYINQIRELYEEGNESDLLEFMYRANIIDSGIIDRRCVGGLLRHLNNALLPTDPNWKSLSYISALNNFTITYDIHNDAEMTFRIQSRETFDGRVEEFLDHLIKTEITDEIAIFVEQENFDERSPRIGNGIQVFTFHICGYESIQRTDEGYYVRVALNVSGYYIGVAIRYADSPEAAFEILANIEFVRGAW